MSVGNQSNVVVIEKLSEYQLELTGRLPRPTVIFATMEETGPVRVIVRPSESGCHCLPVFGQAVLFDRTREKPLLLRRLRSSGTKN